MKLREQASLSCKILALLCIVLALNSLQQTVPQAVGLAGMRGYAGPDWGTVLYMIAPATMMCLFAAALWGVSPFIAALMVPEAVVEKLDDDAQISTLNLGARDGLRIALMILGLWLLVQGSVGIGNILAMRAAAAAYSAAQSAANASIAVALQQQVNWQGAGSALHFIFGILILLLARPISHRAFPN